MSFITNGHDFVKLVFLDTVQYFTFFFFLVDFHILSCMYLEIDLGWPLHAYKLFGQYSTHNPLPAAHVDRTTTV